MSEWFRYLLQSALSMTLLYGIYALFLRKDTFFSINRFYLSFSLIISALIPLVDFSSLVYGTGANYRVILDAIRITPSDVTETVNSNLSTFQVILVAYLTGAFLFLVRFVVQLVQLGWLIHKYGITRQDGIRLVLIHKNYSPFSFFNLIFINAKDYQPGELREIIEHEKIHVRQWHTLDLVLLEIMTVLQWFNPFIWLYRKSIKGLHEYLADEGVLLLGIKATEYQKMLLNQALGIQLNDLTNNFNHSLLKRRFIMMNKQKSGKMSHLKPLLALPLIALMAIAFSFSGALDVYGQDSPSGISKASDKELPPPPPPPKNQDVSSVSGVKSIGKEEAVFKEVAHMPEFKGGQEAFINYIRQNVNYPEDAKKAGIKGKVYVEFILNKSGKVSSAWIKKSVNPALDAEALRVVLNMPDWTPGRDESNKPVNVQMALPIVFSLE